jgi:peroxiredoxin
VKNTCFVLALALAACNHGAVDSSISPVPAASNGASPAAPASALPVADGAHAAVGQPAPDFTLADLDGKQVSLHDYKGKVVVLEWFNPGCPFVNASHLRASLKGMAARREAQGIVWLAINSAAEGKEGSGVEKDVAAKAKFGLDHPILLDTTGAVGHAYGATNTPNMFVVDSNGTLVYRGAIDNSPDGEGQSPRDEHGGIAPKLVNYVDAALDDLGAKRPVAIAETKAYGCGVKYK